MTVTYTFPINDIDISEYLKQYNNTKRFALERLKEGLSLSKTEKLIKKEMNNNELMDVSLIKMAVNEIKNLVGVANVIFGSKYLFDQLKRGKKEKLQEYRDSRNSSMLLRGSSSDYSGNRKATLDIENNQIILKLNRDTHIPLQFTYKLRDKKLRELLLLQEKCEAHEAFFTLRVFKNKVQISF
jgi:hypothetical protein